LTAAPPADAASLRPGHVVLAIGNHEGAPIASLGIVAIAGRRRRSTVSSISSWRKAMTGGM
jgi:S1-C subfamily serine protease